MDYYCLQKLLQSTQGITLAPRPPSPPYESHSFGASNPILLNCEFAGQNSTRYNYNPLFFPELPWNVGSPEPLFFFTFWCPDGRWDKSWWKRWYSHKESARNKRICTRSSGSGIRRGTGRRTHNSFNHIVQAIQGMGTLTYYLLLQEFWLLSHAAAATNCAQHLAPFRCQLSGMEGIWETTTAKSNTEVQSLPQKRTRHEEDLVDSYTSLNVSVSSNHPTESPEATTPNSYTPSIDESL